MAFRSRRAMSLRPVHSIKHIVDVASAVVTNVVTNIQLIQSVDAPTLANTQQVETGSTVHAIYLRVEALATGTFVSIPRVYMAIFKNPGGNLPIINPNSTGDSDDKKWVIHQEMMMVANGATEGAIPRTMFQGVIKIPPKLKRFGINDTLVALFQHDVAETTGITKICTQTIYKEFR